MRAPPTLYTPGRGNNFTSVEEIAAEVTLPKITLPKERDSLAQVADDQRLRQFRRRKAA
jgi:hypothetical protein